MQAKTAKSVDTAIISKGGPTKKYKILESKFITPLLTRKKTINTNPLISVPINKEIPIFFLLLIMPPFHIYQPGGRYGFASS